MCLWADRQGGLLAAMNAEPAGGAQAPKAVVNAAGHHPGSWATKIRIR
jgi:hypothetical protein